MEGIARNLACWRIPTTFRTDYILVLFVDLANFRGMSKGVKCGVSGQRMRGMVWHDLNLAC